MAKRKIASKLSPIPIVPSLSLIDGCPCLGCPYGYNGECIDLKYSASCQYIETWVLGLHLSGTNKNKKVTKTKTHVKPIKSLGRWELHRRIGKLKRHGW